MFLFKVPPALLELPESAFGTNIEELMLAFPKEQLQVLGNERTRWKIDSGKRETGRFAVAILRYDKGSEETLIFGAIEKDTAPEHEHLHGEVILTLAGSGYDVTDEEDRVELRRGSVIVHGKNSIHAPGSERFWVFLYYQPRGMRFT